MDKLLELCFLFIYFFATKKTLLLVIKLRRQTRRFSFWVSGVMVTLSGRVQQYRQDNEALNSDGLIGKRRTMYWIKG